MTLEEVRAALAPFYLQIKFVHVLSVMIWGWSTAVAYGWYVRVAWTGWQRKPDDPEALRRRDWALEQFDRGAVMEHVAFPLLLVTGLLLFLIGGWTVFGGPLWMTVKLAIVIFVFVPMEILDVRLAHGRGNLARLRKSQQAEAYQQSILGHRRFLSRTTPIVMLLVPLTIYLAIVKPA